MTSPRLFARIVAGCLALTCNLRGGDAMETWTSHTFPSVPLGWCSPIGSGSGTHGVPLISKVAVHGGVFVAAGTGPCIQDTPTVILWSADGITWTPNIWPTNTNPWGVPPSWNGLYGVTASSDLLVGVGFGGAIVASGDGKSWGGTSYGPGYGLSLNAAAYGLGRYVAVGGEWSAPNGVIATSTNGLNWTSATFPFSSRPTNGCVAIAFGNGMFLVSTPTRLHRSTDGVSFVPRGGVDAVRLLCFGNGQFVRVGNSLRVSTNDTDWVAIPQPTTAPINTLTFGAGMFVASAARDVATSLDGFNWKVRTNALPQGAGDLTFGNGVFMAVSGSNYFVSPVARLSTTAGIGTLQVHGLQNRQYDILATNDVTTSNWPTLARITLTNSPQSWSDPGASGAPNTARYYRTRLVP